MVTKNQVHRLLSLCDELQNRSSNLSVALFDAQAIVTDEDAPRFARCLSTAHETAELLCAHIQAMHNAATDLDATADQATDRK
jgi:hypothetical protein